MSLLTSAADDPADAQFRGERRFYLILSMLAGRRQIHGDRIHPVVARPVR